jgi:outer membrane biosynthesis protein TonB
MYTDYKAKCMGDVPPKIKPIPSPPKPVPSPPKPVPSPPQPYPKPTPKKYIPSNPDVDPTPSVLPGDSSSANKKYVPPEAEKKSYFFRKFIILGVVGIAGYWIYKRRTEFNYASFRMSRTRNAYPYPTNGQEYGGDSEGMYDSLTMMDQSGGTSFQAPSLPPPPSAYSGAPPSTYDGAHAGAPPPNTGYPPHPYGGSA